MSMATQTLAVTDRFDDYLAQHRLSVEVRERPTNTGVEFILHCCEEEGDRIATVRVSYEESRVAFQRDIPTDTLIRYPDFNARFLNPVEHTLKNVKDPIASLQQRSERIYREQMSSIVYYD